MSRLIGGHARFSASLDPSALADTRAGIEQLEHVGRRLHMSYNWSLALARAGEHAQAEQAAERAHARCEDRDRQGESAAVRALAMVTVRDRQLTRASDRMARAMHCAHAKAQSESSRCAT